METVQLQPGDCLIFTEKLLHATSPYTGDGQRRTLFYKYLPYGVLRQDEKAGGERKRYDLTHPCISEAQKLILGWPDEWAGSGVDPSTTAKM